MTADANAPVVRAAAPGPALLIRVAVVVLLGAAAIGTPADADLWGHLTFGRDILHTGHAVQADAYSFTADRPWVNHEWLAEVAFASSYAVGGAAGLVAFKTGMIAALVAILWWFLRRQGVSPNATIALIAIAFVGTYWRTHTVRPQLFSVVFAAVVFAAITAADAGRRRALYVVPLIMALWVNLHGGWLVGGGILAMWILARVFESGATMRDRTWLLLLGAASLAATLVNPWGWRMWTFLAETVRPNRGDIEEWGSILTYPVALGVPWLMTLIAGVWAVVRSRPPRPRVYVAIAAVLAIASFRTSRLDAFFALAVVMLVAPGAAALPGADPGRRAASGSRQRPAAGVIVVTVAAALAVVIPAARMLGPQATCLAIGGPWVPEEDAARFVQQNHLSGKLLTWFDWGEYAIWHFSPGLRVSMDGRRETLYSEDLIQAHRRFYAADDTSSAFLTSLDPDYIWVPARLPVAADLEHRGWIAAFRGPTSIVFAKAGSGPFQPVPTSVTTRRCFPGP